MRAEFCRLLERAASHVGQRVAPDRRAELDSADHQPDDMPIVQRFSRAWRDAGLQGDSLVLEAPAAADLPFVGWRAGEGWFIATAPDGRGGWQAESADGKRLRGVDLAGCVCMTLPRVPAEVHRPVRAITYVRRALQARKRVFMDAIVATAVINLLSLAASLYSMQVYDRVIPNQGLQTLWVLSVGVVLALLLELLLKHVRARSLEHANQSIDYELSRNLFERLLDIRLEKRPDSVGALAARIKGFEMVRGVLAATSLFVLADIPFALFFVVVIGLIGGPVVLVPIVALPLALIAGLMFQRAITRLSRENLAGNHRKTGLLVESIEGAESLKASGGDWKFQTRWNDLSREAGFAEQDMRNLAALSQHLTGTLQQLGYIALIAVGAYLAVDNQLSMGALLACSIISNRAMMPIVQLPGVMVQWAQARVALESLDQVLSLPGESDSAAHALSPGQIDASLRFERARFIYGAADRSALEIDSFEIRRGERVGVLGTIGSGKSTLLKIAAGVYRPTQGKVFMGGLDMSLIASAARHEVLGYLPQDLRLFSGTLRDNLLLGLADPGDADILEAARMTGLIDLVSGQPRGLALELSEGGRGVSGGQKQLIALTRLVLARPSLLVLDEPTGAMDPVSENRMVGVLRDLAANGTTLLVATHKSALLELFDRLIVMHAGRVVMDGPRDVVAARLAGSAGSVGQPGQQP